MEIERKFLVKELPKFLKSKKNVSIEQSYLSFDPEIRIRKWGSKYFLTVKGNGDISRDEFEIEITKAVYDEFFPKVIGRTILKTRYSIPMYDTVQNIAYIAELDIYKNIKYPECTVEVEFETEEEAKLFNVPKWFGKEITYDKKYKNKNLAQMQNIFVLLDIKRECERLCPSLEFNFSEPEED